MYVCAPDKGNMVNHSLSLSILDGWTVTLQLRCFLSAVYSHSPSLFSSPSLLVSVMMFPQQSTSICLKNKAYFVLLPLKLILSFSVILSAKIMRKYRAEIERGVAADVQSLLQFVVCCLSLIFSF